MYILAPNGTAEVYPYSIVQLKSDNPQVSFPKNPDDTLLASYSVFPVTAAERPVHDPITQNTTLVAPVLDDGVWMQAWEITAASAEEIEQRTEDLVQTLRGQRDQLLLETDWMALSDNTMTPEWASYRQALRDITAQEGFPYEVEWPIEP